MQLERQVHQCWERLRKLGEIIIVAVWVFELKCELRQDGEVGSIFETTFVKCCTNLKRGCLPPTRHLQQHVEEIDIPEVSQQAYREWCLTRPLHLQRNKSP